MSAATQAINGLLAEHEAKALAEAKRGWIFELKMRERGNALRAALRAVEEAEFAALLPSPRPPRRSVTTYVPRPVSEAQSRQAIREAIVDAPRDGAERALRPSQ